MQPSMQPNMSSTYPTKIFPPQPSNGHPGELMPWVHSTCFTSKYNIVGNDTQVLQVLLMPGETCVSEPRSLLFRPEGVAMQTRFGGLGQAFKRALVKESFFKNVYTNQTAAVVSLAFTPSFPAKIMPIDLNQSGPMYCKPGAYIAHLGDVNITFSLVRSLSAAFCGGSGIFLLKLTGTGTVFLVGGGTITHKVLAPGEKLLFDSDSLMGYSHGGQYDAVQVEGCLTCFCGGEGCFNPVVTGPTLVMVQSLSKPRFMSLFLQHSGGGAAQSVNSQVGNSQMVTGVAGMIH